VIEAGGELAWQSSADILRRIYDRRLPLQKSAIINSALTNWATFEVAFLVIAHKLAKLRAGSLSY
jgi:hypothetical protein